MTSITDKIGQIEEKLDRKADKSSVEDLDKRVKCLESKGAESQVQSINQYDTVRETLEEQKEREFRVKNIVI